MTFPAVRATSYTRLAIARTPPTGTHTEPITSRLAERAVALSRSAGVLLDVEAEAALLGGSGSGVHVLSRGYQ